LEACGKAKLHNGTPRTPESRHPAPICADEVWPAWVASGRVPCEMMGSRRGGPAFCFWEAAVMLAKHYFLVVVAAGLGAAVFSGCGSKNKGDATAGAGGDTGGTQGHVSSTHATVATTGLSASSGSTGMTSLGALCASDGDCTSDLKCSTSSADDPVF